jgi:hypothetical protein
MHADGRRAGARLPSRALTRFGDSPPQETQQGWTLTLASNGTISAGQLDHLGPGNDANLPFTGTATAVTSGRGTISISNVNGTFNYAYYPASTTESFLVSLDGAGGSPLVQGEMLQQSGRPFDASAFSAPMTFAADADGTPGGTSVRTGTIVLQGTPNTLTMTYSGTNSGSPDANSGFVTYSVSPNGRVRRRIPLPARRAFSIWWRQTKDSSSAEAWPQRMHQPRCLAISNRKAERHSHCPR